MTAAMQQTSGAYVDGNFCQFYSFGFIIQEFNLKKESTLISTKQGGHPFSEIIISKVIVRLKIHI